jgi:hypothetical protein
MESIIISNSKYNIAARIKVTKSKSGLSWTATIQDYENNFYGKIKSTHSIDDIIRKWIYQCFNEQLQTLKELNPLPKYLSIDSKTNKLHITNFNWIQFFYKMGYVFITGWHGENFILLRDARYVRGSNTLPRLDN